MINSKFFEISEKDEDILNHLKNITIKLSEESLDFTVTFHFEKNNFFDHETLFKNYVYDKSSFEPISATASVVTWKEGKNPSIKMITKKIKSN